MIAMQGYLNSHTALKWVAGELNVKVILVKKCDTLSLIFHTLVLPHEGIPERPGGCICPEPIHRGRDGNYVEECV